MINARAFGDLDYPSAFLHDIGLLESASGLDIVLNGIPFFLLYHHVLATLIEDSFDFLPALQFFDLLDYFICGQFELVSQIL